jgi:GTPase Era involved in 16S rRNA processing
MSGPSDGVLSKIDCIIEEISTIYTQDSIGLLAVSNLPHISRRLRRKIFAPEKKVVILVVGEHSTGKSSLVNWFFGDNIQKVSAAIETSRITFVTTGRKRLSLDGTSTLQLFSFLEDCKTIPGFVENLQTEMRLPVEDRSSLVTFIDTPGLISDRTRLPFDCEAITLKLAEHCHRIIVMIDPIAQAFSQPLKDFIKKAHRTHRGKMHFFLSKADTLNQEERARIVASVSQSLSECIEHGTLDLRPLYVLRDQSKRENEIESENALDYVCEFIEDSVNNTIQATRSQLSKDLSDITRAAEEACACFRKRNERFSRLTLVLIGVLGYEFAAVLFKKVKFFQGLHLISLTVLFAWIVCFLMKPSHTDMKIIRDFFGSTAKSARSKLTEYWDEVKASKD